MYRGKRSENESGGEGLKVGEHRAVVVFEFEAFTEPRALSRDDLTQLMARLKTTVAVAAYVGASQAFVWERLKSH